MSKRWRIVEALVFTGHDQKRMASNAALRLKRTALKGDEVKLGTRWVKAYCTQLQVTLVVHRRKVAKEIA